ncbi:CRISPR-associated ring nuclease Crn3/Csx3 [Baaleninema simplex]|uniref:CRISPR-associated ring nuclease Crn3/Csx3 n=1 Tax=Baaleninema simplex TaxID=2862350 RepID=UPI00034CE890|nr:CRISPR-associated ring nuclease Crn3/Csx3 [Baaleninema simplex]
MTPIKLRLISHQTRDGYPYQHLHVRIATEDGIITPADLKNLTLPAGIDFRQGIAIEGKAPIWLYGYLVHECHPAAWVGCYDPRLGIVVVSSHTHQVRVSQVLDIELPEADTP